jgi:2-oxoglutarate ferredoxin oxidoreductase subunit gamma
MRREKIMSKTHEIIIAGFGGQGVMFAGKLITVAGMIYGKEVSWLPSYGPEMRGGTANCNVIVSEEPVGSPIVVKPTTLIAMNRPSLDKFENTVLEDGIILIDSYHIKRKVEKKDVKAVELPATAMASEMGFATLANMMLVGKWLKESQAIPFDVIKETLNKIVPSSRKNLIDINIKALEKGYNY